MGVYTIKNNELAVLLTTHGAELKSLKDCRTRREYMWNANPLYWKRTSPVLFPLVGNYRNKEVRHNGHVYSLPQHGFARDMDFELMSVTQNEIWFFLESNADTLRQFPFRFRLEIGYRLDGRKLEVLWNVQNRGEETMYFSIGGHSAFVCPLEEGEKQSEHYISFDAEGEVVSRMIGADGLASDTLQTYPLDGGCLQIGEHLFDDDALVIENHQAHRVSLCTPDRKPYVTVSFAAPVFGVWSVPHKTAPFVCIEPWYGRCDRADFSGTLQEREWSNALDPGGVFTAEYTIEI